MVNDPTLVGSEMAHIEALLDDPMIKLIMAIDGVEREEARQLFYRVARQLQEPFPTIGASDDPQN